MKKEKWLADGKTIKTTSKCGNKSIIAYAISKEGNMYYNTEKEAEHNAKLMSLAPEMLKAIINAELDFNLLGIKEHAPMRKNLLDIIQKATS